MTTTSSNPRRLRILTATAVAVVAWATVTWLGDPAPMSDPLIDLVDPSLETGPVASVETAIFGFG